MKEELLKKLTELKPRLEARHHINLDSLLAEATHLLFLEKDGKTDSDLDFFSFRLNCHDRAKLLYYHHGGWGLHLWCCFFGTCVDKYTVGTCQMVIDKKLEL